MATLDDRLRDFSGNEKHDLTKVVPGDILVRDMYNNRSYNGTFNVVSIDKKTGILLMSNGDRVNTDGRNRSGLGVYRLPLTDEIEKETNAVLWRRLCYFDYEFLPKDLLIRINNMLDNHLERRAVRREAKRADENSKTKPVENKHADMSERREKSSDKPRPKLSWSTVGKHIDEGETSWKPKKKKH